MKKYIFLIFIVMSVIFLSSCAHHRRVPLTQRIELGMTKENVKMLCGNPSQVGAMKKNDGKVIESFIYRQTKYNAWTETSRTIDTYVYFEDGKVINYGGEPAVFY